MSAPAPARDAPDGNAKWRITKAAAPTGSGKIWQVWLGTKRRKVLRTWREAVDFVTQAEETRFILPSRVPQSGSICLAITWEGSIISAHVSRSDGRINPVRIHEVPEIAAEITAVSEQYMLED